MSTATNLLYVKVKEKIIEDMKQLNPNDRLPARTQLARQYQVTRTTIDRAISELIGEGYLYSRDGSGTYVAASEARDLAEPIKNPKVVSWGVILPDITRDTYPGILRGVEDIADKSNINVVICNTDNSSEKQANYINKLIEADVKGLIIVPSIIGETDLEPFGKLQENNIPFIFCNRGVNGVAAPKVTSNSYYGGYLVTRHLIRCGYRRIAYVSLPMYSTALERYQGYLSALAEANLELHEENVFFDDSFDARTGYDSVKRMLEQKNRPDAIFAFNDLIAADAYEAIREAGLQVGDDIGLVGYDDTHICERLPVKLTSVKFKTYEIGSNAAELLLGLIRDAKSNKNKIIILQPELVVRDSSKKVNL